MCSLLSSCLTAWLSVGFLTWLSKLASCQYAYIRAGQFLPIQLACKPQEAFGTLWQHQRLQGCGHGTRPQGTRAVHRSLSGSSHRLVVKERGADKAGKAEDKLIRDQEVYAGTSAT